MSSLNAIAGHKALMQNGRHFPSTFTNIRFQHASSCV